MAKKNTREWIALSTGIFLILVFFGTSFSFYNIYKHPSPIEDKSLIVTNDFTIDFLDYTHATSDYWNKPKWVNGDLETITLRIKPRSGDIISNYAYLIIYEDSKEEKLDVDALSGHDFNEISVYDDDNLLSYRDSLYDEKSLSDFMVLKIANPGLDSYNFRLDKNKIEDVYTGNIFFEVYTSNDGKFHKENKIKSLLIQY
jgi:hypothetical protein